MREKTVLERWQLSYGDTAAQAQSDSIEATVPGAVQLDWMRAGLLPSFYEKDNRLQFIWMENKYWFYRTQVTVRDTAATPVLVLEHMDYSGCVRVNGETVARHEGLFKPVEADLSAYKGQTVALEVVLDPAPKRVGSTPYPCQGTEAADSCKPPFAYGWDWCPRLVTLGLSGAAYIEYRTAAVPLDESVSYRLNEALDHAEITVEYTAREPGRLTLTLTDENGQIAAEKTYATAGAGKYRLPVEQPRLWWPNEQGEQTVYTLTVTHEVGSERDVLTHHIGFRRVRLISNEGSWEENHSCNLELDKIGSATENRYPFTLEVNGRRIFAKGTNWVPPEMSMAQIDPARTDEQIRFLNEAHMNLLRVWGGGFIYDDDFYDLCDRYGIMIWQEFTMACGYYGEDDEHLAVLEQEATYCVRRLRIHPCITIWCGGNELFCAWSRMSEQHQAIRLLQSVTYAHDRFTPFIPTSPLNGVGHGNYAPAMRVPLPGGGNVLREHLSIRCDDHATAYTEFGCCAPSEWEYLQTFMTEEELQQPLDTGMWRAHHAKFTTDSNDELWFEDEIIRRLTGCADDRRTLVDTGVRLQEMMYPQLFEEARRQWPYCSMALNWCYNEPWPTAAGNGLISYPSRRKPCYFSVQDALRGQKLSLRFYRVCWGKEETVECTPWLLNDTVETVPAGNARIILSAGGRDTVLATWDYAAAQPQKNVEGSAVSFRLPPDVGQEFTVRIECDDARLNAVYPLFAVDGIPG